MLMRWRFPPDSPTPCPPRFGSCALARRVMTPWAFAVLAASALSANVASGRTNDRLRTMVALKGNGSCNSSAMSWCRSFWLLSLTSTSSMRTFPCWKSKKRWIRFTKVDLPEPLLPTSPTNCPGRMLRRTASGFGRQGSEPKTTSRNSMAPSIRGATMGTSGSLTVTVASGTSKIRCPALRKPVTRFENMRRAATGPWHIPNQLKNDINGPRLFLSSRTWWPPAYRMFSPQAALEAP